MSAAPYLIGKYIDPLYAMAIGIAAAGVRINREEKEKGHSRQQTMECLKRRVDMVFEKTEMGGKAGGKGS